MASSAGYNKMFPVSWTELHRDARALAWRLADLGPFKGLVAITRGGLVPAAIVARELNLRLIDTVCCSTYERMDRGGKVEVLKGTGSNCVNGSGLATGFGLSLVLHRSKIWLVRSTSMVNSRSGPGTQTSRLYI